MEHNNDEERFYMDISAGNWKQGLNNYRFSFTNLRLRNQTALSKYFWNLKDSGLTSQIKWKITAYNFNGRCNLCIDEKNCIMNVTNLCLNVGIKVV